MQRRTALVALAGTPFAAALAGNSQDVSSDVDVVERAFELLHPGLLRYATPKDVRSNLDDLRRRLTSGQSLDARYLALSEFAATIRCGHTYANFFNQKKAIADALFERSDCLPFHFRWMQGRMIVMRNFSKDEALRPGTEIVAIDGIAASDVLARLMRLARADGSNDAKRIAWLQVLGDDPVEAFDVFWPLCFPRAEQRVKLKACAPDSSAVREVHVELTTSAVRRASRSSAREGVPWTLDLDDPAMARLTMPTWALYNSHWDWKGWLAETFATLASRRTPALIIDLRANEGGLDVGDVLLSHLIDAPATLPSARRRVRYRRVPDDLLPYLDTWDRSFCDWSDRVVRADDRFFRFADEPEDGIATLAPRTPHYSGRVLVLVGPTNSSATFEFASRLRATRRGMLVGEPTGGNLRGINGGAFFFLRLPASGLEIDLPLIGQFPAGPLPPDSGLQPDVLSAPTVADIAAGRDTAFLAAKALASRV